MPIGSWLGHVRNSNLSKPFYDIYHFLVVFLLSWTKTFRNTSLKLFFCPMGVSRKRSSTLNLWKNFNENWDILKPAFLTYYKCKKHEGSINFPTSQIGPVWVRVIFKRWGRRWCVFKQIAKDIYYENVHTTCLALKKIWRIICTSILKVNHSWRKKRRKNASFFALSI